MSEETSGEGPAYQPVRFGRPVEILHGQIAECVDLSRMVGIARRPRGAGVRHHYEQGEMVEYLIDGGICSLLRSPDQVAIRGVQVRLLPNSPYYLHLKNGRIVAMGNDT